MKKQGYANSTIESRVKLLKRLVKLGANLYDPESVKEVIAQQTWSDGRKENAVEAYSCFLKMMGGAWSPPRYTKLKKYPFISTEAEIDQLIAGCSLRLAAFLLLLKETGARAGEIWRLSWRDIDSVTRTVRITPEKGSEPRISHISQKLMQMLESLPRDRGEGVFSKPYQSIKHLAGNFQRQRRRLSVKLKNPRLNRITFHTLRHWKATMEYHKTKDILYVMRMLGHKNIKNTLIYVQLADEMFRDQQEYISKVACNVKEACALVEAGFEYVCDIDGVKIFRKPKY
ncbi:site-specific integrase [Candidatus Bathyarchaeota archaeon]|nr:site-specific integrase [Candidatus Bathyarchaeota archaeon]